MITEPNGTITDEFFHNGEPTTVIRAEGTAAQTRRTISYNAANAPVSMLDENSHRWTYDYDSAGNQTLVTDPLGRTTRFAFDGARDLLSVTAPSGRKRSFTYDAAGNPLTATRTSADAAQSETTTFAYDSHGQLQRVTDALNHATTFGYDAYGNQTSVGTPLGHTTTYGYDADSRLVSSVSPLGNQTGANPAAYRTTWTLDAVGRPTQSTDPLGRRTSAAYDAAGNITSSTDAANRTTTFAYDAENEPISVTRPDGALLKTEYDNAGQITKQIDPNNHATTYTRDALERVSTLTDPLNRATTFAYDRAGNLTSSTDALQRTITRFYDEANQLYSVDYSSGNPSTATRAYDADGRLIHNGNVDFHYDPLGRLASTSNTSAGDTTYSYDAADRLTAIGYPASGPAAGVTVTHTLDADGQITAINDGHQHQSTYAYDADGQITDVTRPDSTSEHDSYDRAGQLTALNDTSTASGAYSFKTTYSYTPAGQLAGADESQNTSGSPLTYSYDTAQRLTSNGHNAAYAYDPAGNLTSRPILAKPSTVLGINPNPTPPPTTYDTVTQAFDAANQLTSTSASGSNAGPATTYQYDADGQRTQNSTPASGCIALTLCTTPAHTTTYGYDQAGQLTTYTDTAGSTTTNTTYSYDATGLRTSQNSQANPNTWDRSGSIAQLLSDNTNAYVYGADGLPLEALASNATVTVYHHDIQGSTRAITNLSGTAQATYSYDPYGALNGNVKTAATTNPFLYAGQYTDPTGLQYLRARYYDPTTGQFLTRDPLETQTGQAYNYAADDPTDLSDPTGLCSLLDCLQSAGNAISQSAAGALDAITIGQSTRLAGKIFGFDPACLNLGTAGHIGSNLAIVASFLDGEGEAALAAKATEGIYEVVTREGLAYVGQSGNIGRRLAEHVRSGKISQDAAETAIRTEVLGGKTAREIAEQQRINELTNGVGARDPGIASQRNPIGPARQHLLP